MQYIGTISMSHWSIGGIKAVFKRLDLHELYVGREVGKGGFNHYQFCADCAGDLEEYAKRNSLGWHIEKCISWDISKNYCRKEGNYSYFGDSIEEGTFRGIRDRTWRNVQMAILDSLTHQNDRQITVWVDRKGSAGKSSLLYTMERNGKWCSIPRTEQQPNRMNDYVAMHYENEEVIVLDLARARRLEVEQTEVLEDIKDGLVKSTKYEGHKRFIKGVKLLVYTNNWIPYESYTALTKDRWDIHVIPKEEEEEHDNGVLPPRTNRVRRTSKKTPREPKKKSEG